jgi:hypothetical protein
MLYTLGRVLFPKMLHRENDLRVRMRWVTFISGMVLVITVVSVLWYAQRNRPRMHGPEKPLEHQGAPTR